jgi:hypothetical protein
MTYADIWKKLSVIDVSEHIKSRKIGERTLSWIPWSDCLAILQSHYPDFEYEFFTLTAARRLGARSPSVTFQGG